MTSRKPVSGNADTAGPSAATTTPRTASAASVPAPAERQSRAVPAASTIVVASTPSTAQARNTATNSAPAPPVIATRVPFPAYTETTFNVVLRK